MNKVSKQCQRKSATVHFSSSFWFFSVPFALLFNKVTSSAAASLQQQQHQRVRKRSLKHMVYFHRPTCHCSWALSAQEQKVNCSSRCQESSDPWNESTDVILTSEKTLTGSFLRNMIATICGVHVFMAISESGSAPDGEGRLACYDGEVDNQWGGNVG